MSERVPSSKPSRSWLGIVLNRSDSPQDATFFKVLDGLLRRRETYFEAVFDGVEIGRQCRWYLVAILFLSAFYGLTMGMMGFTSSATAGFLQTLTSAMKVPALYLLTLGVCFPVLYIVLVLMGARLTFGQTLALILLALTLNAVLLASCAPIVFFFLLAGSTYDFVKLLHVVIFTFSGAWAMMALWQGLRVMCEKSDLYPKQAIRILQLWILVFGFVGTQMAWSLRPFVGSPGMEYQLFRKGQEGNFYSAVWHSLANLAGAQQSHKPRAGTSRQPVENPE